MANAIPFTRRDAFNAEGCRPNRSRHSTSLMIAAAGAPGLVVHLQERPPDLHRHPDEFRVPWADDLGEALPPGVADADRRRLEPDCADERRQFEMRLDSRHLDSGRTSTGTARRPRRPRCAGRGARSVSLTGRSSSVCPSANARPTATIPTPSMAAAHALENGRRISARQASRASRRRIALLRGLFARVRRTTRARATRLRRKATPARPSALSVAR